MADYLDAIYLEAYLQGAWVDLTADVLLDMPISVEYGIRDNGPLARVASPGSLKFSLRDNTLSWGGRAGTYTPGSPYRRPGWDQGALVRLTLVYDGDAFVKFRGRVIEIQPDLAALKTQVVAQDWMGLAASHDLHLPAYTQNKRIGEVVALITENMPIRPLTIESDIGQDVYPDVFDTVRSGTKALTEIAKVANSELGYVYIRYGQGRQEVLAVEGRYTRSALTSPARLELPASLAGTLLDEGGNRLLQENGGRLLLTGDLFTASLNRYVYTSAFDLNALMTEQAFRLLAEGGDRLLLDEVSLSAVENPFRALDIQYGDLVYNQVRYTAYPRLVDSNPTTVLFSLQVPIALAAGETKRGILGRYRDPVGGAARVSGRDLQTPTATTDYLLNANESGSGTNLTANLVVVAAYGTEGVSYTLTNTGGVAGYVTKLQARGRGVYTYDPVTLLVEDTSSQAVRGVQSLTLDLKYQRRADAAAGFATLLLDQYRAPRTNVRSVTFLANYNPQMMTMFLRMEPGQRFRLSERVSGVDQDYFINGVQAQIVNKIIQVKWFPQSATFALAAYWLLETAGRSELDQTTTLGY